MRAEPPEKPPVVQGLERQNLTSNPTLDPTSVVHVFGYGSLMWRPGFAHLARFDAVLEGYHRDFCVISRHHRGTDETPGLVLGLDQGGACRGAAFEFHPEHQANVLAYLDARELVGYPYLSVIVEILVDGQRTPAFTYIVDPSHPDYAGHLTTEERGALIRGAQGLSGTNLDYFQNLTRHLGELDIDEPQFRALDDALKAL